MKSWNLPYKFFPFIIRIRPTNVPSRKSVISSFYQTLNNVVFSQAEVICVSNRIWYFVDYF